MTITSDTAKCKYCGEYAILNDNDMCVKCWDEWPRRRKTRPIRKNRLMNVRNHYRRRHGLCVQCGKPSSGKYYCEEHGKRLIELREIRRQKRRDNHLCPECGRKPAKNKSLCPTCLRKEAEEQRVERLKHRESGLCGICNDPATNGYYCKKHAKDHHKWQLTTYKNRIKNHRCPYCGKPHEGKVNACDNCRKYHRFLVHRRREKYKALGICTRCGSRPALSGFQTCELCHSKEMLRKRKPNGWANLKRPIEVKG